MTSDYDDPSMKANISTGKFDVGLLTARHQIDFFDRIFDHEPSSRMRLADVGVV